MDAKELRELIEIISRSNFSTFELEREGFKLRLVKGTSGHAPAVVETTASAVPVAPHDLPRAPDVASAAGPGVEELPSPIVGTFYLQSSPGSPAFVEVGSRVKKGQVLCIIEAMKLMNEIEAEIEAEIVEICIANGQPVEFGEVLFRLRPLS